VGGTRVALRLLTRREEVYNFIADEHKKAMRGKFGLARAVKKKSVPSSRVSVRSVRSRIPSSSEL
jgi:hypothetical protein